MDANAGSDAVGEVAYVYPYTNGGLGDGDRDIDVEGGGGEEDGEGTGADDDGYDLPAIIDDEERRVRLAVALGNMMTRIALAKKERVAAERADSGGKAAVKRQTSPVKVGGGGGDVRRLASPPRPLPAAGPSGALLTFADDDEEEGSSHGGGRGASSHHHSGGGRGGLSAVAEWAQRRVELLGLYRSYLDDMRLRALGVEAGEEGGRGEGSEGRERARGAFFPQFPFTPTRGSAGPPPHAAPVGGQQRGVDSSSHHSHGAHAYDSSPSATRIARIPQYEVSAELAARAPHAALQCCAPSASSAASASAAAAGGIGGDVYAGVVGGSHSSHGHTFSRRVYGVGDGRAADMGANVSAFLAHVRALALLVREAGDGSGPASGGGKGRGNGGGDTTDVIGGGSLIDVAPLSVFRGDGSQQWAPSTTRIAVDSLAVAAAAARELDLMLLDDLLRSEEAAEGGCVGHPADTTCTSKEGLTATVPPPSAPSANAIAAALSADAPRSHYVYSGTAGGAGRLQHPQRGPLSHYIRAQMALVRYSARHGFIYHVLFGHHAAMELRERRRGYYAGARRHEAAAGGASALVAPHLRRIAEEAEGSAVGGGGSGGSPRLRLIGGGRRQQQQSFGFVRQNIDAVTRSSVGAEGRARLLQQQQRASRRAAPTDALEEWYGGGDGGGGGHSNGLDRAAVVPRAWLAYVMLVRSQQVLGGALQRHHRARAVLAEEGVGRRGLFGPWVALLRITNAWAMVRRYVRRWVLRRQQARYRAAADLVGRFAQQLRRVRVFVNAAQSFRKGVVAAQRLTRQRQTRRVARTALLHVQFLCHEHAALGLPEPFPRVLHAVLLPRLGEAMGALVVKGIVEERPSTREAAEAYRAAEMRELLAVLREYQPAAHRSFGGSGGGGPARGASSLLLEGSSASGAVGFGLPNASSSSSAQCATNRLLRHEICCNSRNVLMRRRAAAMVREAARSAFAAWRGEMAHLEAAPAGGAASSRRALGPQRSRSNTQRGAATPPSPLSQSGASGRLPAPSSSSVGGMAKVGAGASSVRSNRSHSPPTPTSPTTPRTAVVWSGAAAPTSSVAAADRSIIFEYFLPPNALDAAVKYGLTETPLLTELRLRRFYVRGDASLAGCEADGTGALEEAEAMRRARWESYGTSPLHVHAATTRMAPTLTVRSDRGGVAAANSPQHRQYDQPPPLTDVPLLCEGDGIGAASLRGAGGDDGDGGSGEPFHSPFGGFGDRGPLLSVPSAQRDTRSSAHRRASIAAQNATLPARRQAKGASTLVGGEGGGAVAGAAISEGATQPLRPQSSDTAAPLAAASAILIGPVPPQRHRSTTKTTSAETPFRFGAEGKDAINSDSPLAFSARPVAAYGQPRARTADAPSPFTPRVAAKVPGRGFGPSPSRLPRSGSRSPQRPFHVAPPTLARPAPRPPHTTTFSPHTTLPPKALGDATSEAARVGSPRQPPHLSPFVAFPSDGGAAAAPVDVSASTVCSPLASGGPLAFGGEASRVRRVSLVGDLMALGLGPSGSVAGGSGGPMALGAARLFRRSSTAEGAVSEADDDRGSVLQSLRGGRGGPVGSSAEEADMVDMAGIASGGSALIPDGAYAALLGCASVEEMHAYMRGEAQPSAPSAPPPPVPSAAPSAADGVSDPPTAHRTLRRALPRAPPVPQFRRRPEGGGGGGGGENGQDKGGPHQPLTAAEARRLLLAIGGMGEAAIGVQGAIVRSVGGGEDDDGEGASLRVSGLFPLAPDGNRRSASTAASVAAPLPSHQRGAPPSPIGSAAVRQRGALRTPCLPRLAQPPPLSTPLSPRLAPSPASGVTGALGQRSPRLSGPSVHPLAVQESTSDPSESHRHSYSARSGRRAFALPASPLSAHRTVRSASWGSAMLHGNNGNSAFSATTPISMRIATPTHYMYSNARTSAFGGFGGSGRCSGEGAGALTIGVLEAVERSERDGRRRAELRQRWE